jgi:type III pantothenate kinase
MLLVIDVGNTNTAIGLYDGEKLLSDWRLATDRYRTADEWGQLLRSLLRLEDQDTSLIDGIAISNVVPPLDSILERSFLRYFDIVPYFVTNESDLGIEIKYDPPSEVGADRLVNAVGATEHHGCPAIIIDFGTATTFDLISCNKEYLGGVICPGIGISSNALFEKAAKLPRVDLKRPQKVVGTTTVESMQSGLYYGYLQQIKGIIELIQNDIGKKLKVIITGGLARVFAEDLGPEVVEDQKLTLEGLRLIYNRNQK